MSKPVSVTMKVEIFGLSGIGLEKLTSLSGSEGQRYFAHCSRVLAMAADVLVQEGVPVKHVSFRIDKEACKKPMVMIRPARWYGMLPVISEAGEQTMASLLTAMMQAVIDPALFGQPVEIANGFSLGKFSFAV